jgi:hypothetical protein
MSTLKYKAAERYSMGWTDTRMFSFGELKATLGLSKHVNTGLEDVPTETLRNLWMVRFGARNVTFDEMYEIRFDDIAKVAQELANRKLVRHETINRMELDAKIHYYVLEKTSGDS